MNTSQLLTFLDELAHHNDREWFQEHKATYDQLKHDFEKLVQRWITQMAAFDPALSGLEARKCIFRIYRDVRFSTNKDPYKIHFSAYFSAGGKKGGGPGYYVHLSPHNKSFLAGGLYDPEKEQLARVRQEIDYNGDALRHVLQAPGFRKYYGGLEGDKLKKAPAGFPADHPDLEWLKHKSFLVSHPLPDAALRKLDLTTYVPTAFRAMLPFCNYLREAVEHV